MVKEDVLFRKMMEDPIIKDKFIKVLTIIIIAVVILLSFDVFTQNNDGRRQIVDKDGGVEADLCMILSDIEGVGEVDVMLQYDEDEKITGAIVTAGGADDPVVKNNVVNAVMALFDISASNVEVFKKSSEKLLEENSDEN